MKEITKDMLITDILNVNEELAEVLMEAGMHCVGCMAAHGETLEEACAVHEINVDELVKKLNFFNQG